MPQLLVTINDQSKLPNLRRVIKSLHVVDQVMTQRRTAQKPEPTPVVKRQLARIDELAKLKLNWDDEGALPIEPRTLLNVRRLVRKLDDEALSHWAIFPDVNGTILMETLNGNATVSIGNTQFTYTSPQQKGNRQRLTSATLYNVVKAISL